MAEVTDRSCSGWSRADFEDLKRVISTYVPEGFFRESALKRIDPVLDPDLDRDSDRTIAEAWLNRQSRSAPIALFEEERAKIWQQTGCAAEGAPFVVAALAKRLNEFGNDSPWPAQIAAAFLRDDCAGAVGISADMRARLKQRANQTH